MKAVVQRVKNANVEIANKSFSSINSGMLILLCIEKGDVIDTIEWLANKITTLRLFDDDNGKMNKSIKDVSGEILVISQFTLAANCKKGTRPSFDFAEEPQKANELYLKFVDLLKKNELNVKTGRFGANMQVTLINDGPVTFVIEK